MALAESRNLTKAGSRASIANMDNPAEQILQLACALAAIALVVALGRQFLFRPCNLQIRVKEGQVDVGGRALTGRRGQVSDFIQHHLPEVRQARIEGYWDGRRLQLRFKGDLSPGEQQRIRNFLLTVC